MVAKNRVSNNRITQTALRTFQFDQSSTVELHAVDTGDGFEFLFCTGDEAFQVTAKAIQDFREFQRQMLERHAMLVVSDFADCPGRPRHWQKENWQHLVVGAIRRGRKTRKAVTQ